MAGHTLEQILTFRQAQGAEGPFDFFLFKITTAVSIVQMCSHDVQRRCGWDAAFQPQIKKTPKSLHNILL